MGTLMPQRASIPAFLFLDLRDSLSQIPPVNSLQFRQAISTTSPLCIQQLFFVDLQQIYSFVGGLRILQGAYQASHTSFVAY
jgi:hypothetical protein